MPGVTEAPSARALTRRRALTRAGLVVIALATACATTACIFDQGDYQGGGRLGKVLMPEEEDEDEGGAPPPASPMPTGSSQPPDEVPDGGP